MISVSGIRRICIQHCLNRGIQAFYRCNYDGYSLLETLIAISILLIVAAPFLSGLFGNNSAVRSANIITAIGLLEQEARRVSGNADEMVPVRNRNLNGRQWVIKTDKSGSGLIQYYMTAELEGRLIGDIYFLQRE